MTAQTAKPRAVRLCPLCQRSFPYPSKGLWFRRLVQGLQTPVCHEHRKTSASPARDRRIAEMLAMGVKHAAIAAELNVSITTVARVSSAQGTKYAQRGRPARRPVSYDKLLAILADAHKRKHSS